MTTLTKALRGLDIGGVGMIGDTIGFEQIGRAARLLLVERLNDAMAEQEEKWLREDLALQELGLDPGVGQVEIETIPVDHFHEGPHKSFIDAPAEAFPNVSVMAYMTVPSPEQFDQHETVDITLFVETMVKAGPVPDGQETAFETIVHRRIQRTTEAVHSVIWNDKSLLGTVNPIRQMPKGGIGNQSWVRKQQTSSARHMWHGSRLQYTTDRHAHFN